MSYAFDFEFWLLFSPSFCWFEFVGLDSVLFVDGQLNQSGLVRAVSVSKILVLAFFGIC